MTELETDRLLIRELHASDDDAYLQYVLSEHYWRHLPSERPTAESVAELIKHIIFMQTENPRTGYHLAAFDKHSDKFIGETSLYVNPLHRQGAMGWGVVASRVGQGIATEMSRALLRLGFGSLGLHRVQANCRFENHASRRIMAKIDMREEGVIRDNLFVRGEWWSTVQAAILSTDPECSFHGYPGKVGGAPTS